ncbi:MAG TPA: hypothetical protein PKD61_08390 [Polyangiaceae bacterium]|nr:hypothetical protein [Polyangiaceae bacterium]
MPTRSSLSLFTLPLALASFLIAAPGAAETTAASKPACSVSGEAEMPVNLPIYDKADGGTPIARFSGGDTALRATDFFASAGKRVAVETGTGTGSFRISGFTDASKVPVFSAHRLSVVPGHLYIAPHQRLEVTSGANNRLKVKKRITTPIHQTFNTWVDCSSLTLARKSSTSHTVSGHARGYVLKKDNVELYDTWQKDRTLVTVLNKAAGSTGVLLWSEEQRGGWVHVEYHGEVIINAWARSRELRALPRGETMDVKRGAVTKRSPPQLKLADTPKVVKTTKEIPIRSAAKDDAPIIGKIEADTETYVLDIMAGWASVLPKSLNVAPHGDGQFWVKASDVTP